MSCFVILCLISSSVPSTLLTTLLTYMMQQSPSLVWVFLEEINAILDKITTGIKSSLHLQFNCKLILGTYHLSTYSSSTRQASFEIEISRNGYSNSYVYYRNIRTFFYFQLLFKMKFTRDICGREHNPIFSVVPTINHLNVKHQIDTSV